jgi:hypothetical protein
VCAAASRPPCRATTAGAARCRAAAPSSD